MQPVLLCELTAPPLTLRRVAASATRVSIAVLGGLAIITLMTAPRTSSGVEHRERHHEWRDAHAKAIQFAVVAFERWTAAHPGAQCPASFSELRRYATDRTPFDPWGGVFEMRCDASGLRVRSPGPDRVFGTTDDVERFAPP